MKQTTDLAKLYRHRFQPDALAPKRRIWKVLCRDFFSRYVRADAVVLDLACGYGEFINEIVAAKKFAIDLNPDSPDHVAKDVTFYSTPADDLSMIADSSVDVVFTSNFFEHLPTKNVLNDVLSEVLRVLRPGGRILMMGPNIRYLPGEYWDFYDHHIPLSEHSLSEGLVSIGFEIHEAIGKFLPYTTISRIPQHPLLVALYLRVRPAWWLMGKQFFVVAAKPKR
jgi:SAM-dependent methyltransferase